MQPIVIQRGNTIEVPVSIGFNVSGETLTSKIYVDDDPLSAVIAEWTVSFITDGSDGELLLTLSYLITEAIVQSSGHMDLRKTSGTPVDLLEQMLEVIFQGP